MSSRGVTRAQLEARRREMERQREEQRRKEVMANIQAVATEIRRQHGDLVEQGHAAWVAEELKRQYRRFRPQSRHLWRRLMLHFPTSRRCGHPSILWPRSLNPVVLRLSFRPCRMKYGQMLLGCVCCFSLTKPLPLARSMPWQRCLGKPRRC